MILNFDMNPCMIKMNSIQLVAKIKEELALNDEFNSEPLKEDSSEQVRQESSLLNNHKIIQASLN
jgi:hypothetical protein